jgi:hypothetical protein
MSELDSKEEQILARARRAFAPSDTDAARVLRATSLALGLPVSGAVSSSANANAGADTSASASGGANAATVTGAAKLSPLTAAAGKWLAGLAVVCAAAGGGYVYGFRAGREVSQREAASAAATTATPASATLKPSSAPPIPSVAARALSASASLATASATDPQPSAAGEAAVTRDAPPTRSLSARPPAAAAPPAHAQSLQAELRALRRVESLLREGNAEVALRVLAQLDRDFPRGQMLEERAAAWALARCTRARSDEVANDFNQRYPGSVYAERVLAACAAPAAISFDNRLEEP